MGLYINPQDGSSKESWLQQNAREVSQAEFVFKTGDGEVPLVLVDNTMFTACAVAHSLGEFNEFTQDYDLRRRKFYYAPIDAVIAVTNGGDEGKYDLTAFNKT